MSSQGMEGVTYTCGEWEHGQLGLPLARDFHHPDSASEPPPPLASAVPSTGSRVSDKGQVLHPIPAVDENNLVSRHALVPVPLLRDHHVLFAAAGGDHTLFVTDAGRVFACGRNDSFQLGVSTAEGATMPSLSTGARLGVDRLMQEGADAREMGPEPVQLTSLRWKKDAREMGPEPVQLTSLRWKKVRAIACGDAHSLALTSEGEVYAWGLGAGGRLGLGHYKTVGAPCKVTVTDVVAGYYHSLCLAEGGAAYAWGSGDAGQLGTGKASSTCTPAPIQAPPVGSAWESLAAGEYHSMGVSDTGSLMSWGLNSCGQLGLGDHERRLSPTCVQGLMGNKTAKVACGASFTIVVARSGLVFSWGDNSASQLGQGDSEERVSPTPVVSLRGVTVESIACGGKHVACIDSTGKLWTWGGNEGGCLGLGDAQRRAAPAPVPSSAELGLQQAVCGYSHTVLVSKFEASQVQSRAFFLHGLVHMDDPIENQFCLYPWGQGTTRGYRRCSKGCRRSPSSAPPSLSGCVRWRWRCITRWGVRTQLSTKSPRSIWPSWWRGRGCRTVRCPSAAFASVTRGCAQRSSSSLATALASPAAWCGGRCRTWTYQAASSTFRSAPPTRATPTTTTGTSSSSRVTSASWSTRWASQQTSARSRTPQTSSNSSGTPTATLPSTRRG
ncbi:regulator of chromosome condensation 1/beta-lactamase-inhibitor protein II, partial [Baffinella frigidus]